MSTEDWLNSLTKVELINICKRLQLATSGKKALLIHRIQHHNSGTPRNYPHTPQECARQPVARYHNGGVRCVDPPMAANVIMAVTENVAPTTAVNLYEPNNKNCLCGKSLAAQRPIKGKSFTCCECLSQFHGECYNVSNTSDDIMCSWCRVKLLDPFHELDQVLLCVKLKSSWFTYILDCRSLREWKARNKEIIVTCYKMDSKKLKHKWPHSLSLSINHNKELDVPAPSWEHKRRDSPFKLTSFIKLGSNLIDISWKNYDSGGVYVLCIGLYDPIHTDIIARTITKSQIVNFEDTRQRILNIVNVKSEDEEVECMEVSRRVKLSCPVMFTRIEIACRGRYCRHLQCYDLIGFLQVTRNMKAFKKRWKCPECNLIVRPRDLIVDEYFMHLLRNSDDSVSVVELQPDGSFRVVTDQELLEEAGRAERERQLAENTTSREEIDLKRPMNVTEILELDDEEDEMVGDERVHPEESLEITRETSTEVCKVTEQPHKRLPEVSSSSLQMNDGVIECANNKKRRSDNNETSELPADDSSVICLSDSEGDDELLFERFSMNEGWNESEIPSMTSWSAPPPSPPPPPPPPPQIPPPYTSAHPPTRVPPLSDATPHLSSSVVDSPPSSMRGPPTRRLRPTSQDAYTSTNFGGSSHLLFDAEMLEYQPNTTIQKLNTNEDNNPIDKSVASHVLYMPDAVDWSHGKTMTTDEEDEQLFNDSDSDEMQSLTSIAAVRFTEMYGGSRECAPHEEEGGVTLMGGESSKYGDECTYESGSATAVKCSSSSNPPDECQSLNDATRSFEASRVSLMNRPSYEGRRASITGGVSIFDEYKRSYDRRRRLNGATNLINRASAPSTPFEPTNHPLNKLNSQSTVVDTHHTRQPMVRPSNSTHRINHSNSMMQHTQNNYRKNHTTEVRIGKQ